MKSQTHLQLAEALAKQATGSHPPLDQINLRLAAILHALLAMAKEESKSDS